MSLGEFFRWLLETDGFSPRRSCAGLSPELVWTLAISNAATAASYIALAINFGVIIRRRHDRSLAAIFWLLGAFVFLCGMTHAANVMVTWFPAYRLAASVDVVTAVLSVVAAVVTAVYTPRILRVPPVRALYEQGMSLRKQLVDQLSIIAETSKTDPEAARIAMDRLRRGIEGA
jgi:hypothetical protein